MAARFRLRRSNALKHGAYSTIGLLPGESPAVKKHEKAVVDDLGPNGALELDIVLTIARLLWRKQNIATFRLAELVKLRCDQIHDEELESRGIVSRHFQTSEDQAARDEASRAAEKQARSELGDCYKFTEDDIGTVERLMLDLEVEERIDAVIDKCLRRLLMVRGVKSMGVVPRSVPAQLHKPRVVNRPAANDG
jgi:hypothetical protein